MAITVDHLTGFEPGLLQINGSGTAGPPGLATSITNATATTGSARNGVYGAQVVPTGAAAGCVRFNVVQIGTNKRIWRFAFKTATAPSSGSVNVFEVHASTTVRGMVRISSAGLVQASLDGTSWFGSTSVSLTDWHVVEVKLDYSTATNELTWRLDGADQTGTTLASSTGTVTIWTLGTTGVAGPAATIHVDDAITGLWTAAGDWFGDGKVLGYRPTADGTHSVAANQFFPGDTGGTAYTGSSTNAYTMVDDAAPWSATRSTTDNIRQAVVGTSDYLEIAGFSASGSGSANAVRGVLGYSSPATQSNAGACAIRNSAGAAVVVWGDFSPGVLQDYSESANFWRQGVATVPAAGWTASEVSAVKFRIGGSDDIAPVPTWQCLMLEVDWPITSSVIVLDAVGPSSAGATSASSTTLSWTHTNIADDVALVVAVALGTGSDGAMNMTAKLDPAGANTTIPTLGGEVHSGAGTAGFLQLFGLPNVSAGAHTVTVTVAGGTPDNMEGGSVSYTGADLTTAFGTQQSFTVQGTATPGITFTGSTEGNRVVAGLAHGQTITSVTSPGGTSRWIRNVNSNSAAGNGAQADVVGGGTGVITWAATSDWCGIAAVEILAAGGGGGGATATPAVIATAAAVPAATVSTGASITAATVATIAAAPAPTVSTGTRTAPAAVVTVSAVGSPAVSTGTQVTPSSVGTIAAVGSPAVSTGSKVTSATVATAAALPAPTVSGGTNATATPTAVATVAGVGNPSVRTGSTVQPATLATTATLPALSVLTGAKITPVAIATATVIPAPTVSVGSNATITAAAVVTVVGVGAPALQTGLTVQAVSVATVAVLPAATVSTGTKVTPAVVATAAALPAPTLFTGPAGGEYSGYLSGYSGYLGAVPVTIATTAALPAPTVSTGARVSPAAVATASTVPAPAVTGGGNATLTPATIATVGAASAATVSISRTVAPATIATVAAVGAAQPADSAFAVAYAFTGSSPNATTTATNITAGPVTANTDVALGYITTSYTSQPALQVSTVTVTSTTAAAAITNGHHFNFTLTPDAGFALDVSTLVFNVAKGGASVRGVVVRSSLDDYAADLYSADVNTIRPTWTPLEIDLSAVPPTSSAVTFRIYIYTATVAQFVEFDDVTVVGSLIPAPSSISWMGETWNVAQRAAAGDYYNAFDRTMVEVNGSGHLVLKIRNYGGGVIRGAEIASTITGRGYGTYTWELDGQTSSMHDNLVMGGLFTYDNNVATPARNEIDAAEQYTDASGNVRLKHNTWMVDPGFPALRGAWNAARVAGNEIDTLTDASQTNVLVWEPGKLTFRTYRGLSTAPGDLFRESILNTGDAVTINGQATTAVIPTPATDQVHFNLWVRPDWYSNSDPDTVTDFEIVVRSFDFVSSDATATPATIATVAAVGAASTSTGSSVQPATIATVAALPAPTVQTGSTATPAVIATTAAVPAPAVTTSGNATVTPPAIATVAAVPAPTVSTGSRVQPAAIATAAAVPAPSVQTAGNATAAPATIATVSAVGVPTVTAGSAVQPLSVATVAALPVPQLSTGTTATPAVIATVAALPAPTVSAGSTAAPATIVTLTAVSGPAVATGATVTPAAIATVSALPAPAVITSGNATATPASVATTSSVPAATVQTGSTASPATLATVTGVGTPTVQTGSTVTAGIATVAALPAPSISTGSRVSPTAVATVVSVGSATVQTGSTVTAVTIATVAAIPAPSVSTAGNATIAAVVIATAVALPAPSVSTGSSATVAAVVIATVAALPAPSLSTGSRVSPAAIATVSAVGSTAVVVETRVVAVAIVTVSALPAPTFSAGSTVAAQVIASFALVGVPVVLTIEPLVYGTAAAGQVLAGAGRAGSGLAGTGRSGSSLPMRG